MNKSTERDTETHGLDWAIRQLLDGKSVRLRSWYVHTRWEANDGRILWRAGPRCGQKVDLATFYRHVNFELYEPEPDPKEQNDPLEPVTRQYLISLESALRKLVEDEFAAVSDRVTLLRNEMLRQNESIRAHLARVDKLLHGPRPIPGFPI